MRKSKTATEGKTGQPPISENDAPGAAKDSSFATLTDQRVEPAAASRRRENIECQRGGLDGIRGEEAAQN
jgi:hypothetical protein